MRINQRPNSRNPQWAGNKTEEWKIRWVVFGMWKAPYIHYFLQIYFVSCIITLFFSLNKLPAFECRYRLALVPYYIYFTSIEIFQISESTGGLAWSTSCSTSFDFLIMSSLVCRVVWHLDPASHNPVQGAHWEINLSQRPLTDGSKNDITA